MKKRTALGVALVFAASIIAIPVSFPTTAEAACTIQFSAKNTTVWDLKIIGGGYGSGSKARIKGLTWGVMFPKRASISVPQKTDGTRKYFKFFASGKCGKNRKYKLMLASPKCGFTTFYIPANKASYNTQTNVYVGDLGKVQQALSSTC